MAKINKKDESTESALFTIKAASYTLPWMASKKNSQNIYWNKSTNRPFITASAKYKQWHKDTASTFPRRAKPIERCKSITLLFYPPDLRRWDSHNKAESVFDFLVDMDVIIDDKATVTGEEHLIPKEVDKLNPRVEVEILYYEE